VTAYLPAIAVAALHAAACVVLIVERVRRAR